jgi:hypothetical protein
MLYDRWRLSCTGLISWRVSGAAVEEDPEDVVDDLISSSSLLALNLRAGVLDSATPAQVNAIMRHYAQEAETLAQAYRDEVQRRRSLEEEGKTGLYLQGANRMAKALVWAEHTAKQSRNWLDGAAIERRAVESRKAYDRDFTIKLALAVGFGAGIALFALYAFRRGTFYSLAGSLLLLVAAGLMLMAAGTWLDLSRRQKAALKETEHWFALSASETRRAEELRARREAQWAKMRAESPEADEEEDDDDDA